MKTCDLLPINFVTITHWLIREAKSSFLTSPTVIFGGSARPTSSKSMNVKVWRIASLCTMIFISIVAKCPARPSATTYSTNRKSSWSALWNSTKYKYRRHRSPNWLTEIIFIAKIVNQLLIDLIKQNEDLRKYFVEETGTFFSTTSIMSPLTDFFDVVLTNIN